MKNFFCFIFTAISSGINKSLVHIKLKAHAVTKQKIQISTTRLKIYLKNTAPNKQYSNISDSCTRNERISHERSFCPSMNENEKCKENNTFVLY